MQVFQASQFEPPTQLSIILLSVGGKKTCSVQLKVYK